MANGREEPPVLRMRGICKSYGAVAANRGIDLDVPPRRIVGLLGENGSGKSTLMKVLFGMVQADAGSIEFKGRMLGRHTPREALAAGIGMIHQHFMLVEAMSVTENVMLGWDRAGHWLRRREIGATIAAASRTYGLDLDPDARIGDLPFGLRQRVEIMKAILRGAALLILDEPTSNLSPPEVAGLLRVMRRLREEGHAVIFISHKLAEVLEICDEVVVLRDGQVAGRCPVEGATRAALAHMMVGREIAAMVAPAERAPGAEVLAVEAVSYREGGTARLAGIGFTLRGGEILAVAGVDGNGQTELAEVLAGLRLPSAGRIMLGGEDITRSDVKARLSAGLAYIPVDRAATSLVPDMSIEDNLALRDFARPPLRKGIRLDRAAFRARAEARIAEFDIRAARPQLPVRALSGGNQQKLVLAREIGRRPRVLVAMQPTWGLDPGATRFVIEQILALREAGGAVLYISAELEEVLMLGDRIAVMYNGRLSPPVPRAAADVTRIGLMMAGEWGTAAPRHELAF